MNESLIYILVQIFCVAYVVAVVALTVILSIIALGSVALFIKKIFPFFPKKIISGIVYFCSGEFVFKFLSNGGTAVVVRTLITGLFLSIIVYLGHCVVYWNLENPFKVLQGNGWQFCGIFGAAYLSFYSRFVSQWSYLSGLYNQIKEALLGMDFKTADDQKRELLYGWMSGFIEDAITLHMETKDIFAVVILNWLDKYPEIGNQFVEYNSKTKLGLADGATELQKLRKRIGKINK